MQQIILPQAITSLIATDDNGKPIVNFTSAMPVIKAVVQYLQDTRQNLSTADFVDFLFASLGITKDDGDLSAALFCALTSTFINYTTDYAVLYRVIADWLGEQRFDSPIFSRYLCILNADYPMQSTLNPKKIAVWRNTSKMGNWDKRQAVSVRKWIGSTLVGLTDEQAENLACKIDKFLQGETLDNLDIRHHNSYDFEAWERAYVIDAIRSCMNPLRTSCEVGTKRTFTTYCSGYHGLADNGLSLTVLYQNSEPVARAITFKNGEQDCYIKTYGDDRLHKWLQANGYEQSGFVSGTILYTTENLMKPYVDGDLYRADHHINSDGKHYWVLCTDGEYNLQTTDAFANPQTECECCGNRLSDDVLGEYQSAVNGNWYTVCDRCHENNCYYVYTGGCHSERVFFHDGYSPETNDNYILYDGEYYHEDSLEEYDLRLVDGKVYHYDDLYYCEITDEYFTDSDDVYTDADEISTTQPVDFPYDCVSKDYWDNNVVECACGTLALAQDTKKLRTPSLGDVVTLSAYWCAYRRYNGAGVEVVQPIFNIDAIESDYDLYETEQMQAFMDYAIAYNTIQYLRFQELGI